MKVETSYVNSLDTNPQYPVDRRTARSRHRPTAETNLTGRRFAALSLTALGVVYGDIGTSPLYAFRVCFNQEYGRRRGLLLALGLFGAALLYGDGVITPAISVELISPRWLG